MAPNKPYTTGATDFQSDRLFEDEALVEQVHQHLTSNDLLSAICTAFAIPPSDRFVYHATASVTLPQVQQAVAAGPSHGLHDWYLDAESQPKPRPEAADITAYISIFDPSKSSANILKGIRSNAKKQSLRAGIADYLTSKRFFSPSVFVSRRKRPHSNPYIDFWAWACHSLEWAGPDDSTGNLKMSHHVLPIFMHHFGCACPSYESLEILKKLAAGNTILDMGSGNGYWAMMLRRHGCEVIAVDNGQSSWRTCWIGDTIQSDGVQFMKKRGQMATNDDVLLMVYPIVGGDFTKKILDTYRGNLIAIAGTQNGNGYTGFKDQVIDEWMAKERSSFEKIVQLPLPSFPGKDDALFVFQRTGA